MKSGGQTGRGRSGTVTFAILHIVHPSQKTIRFVDVNRIVPKTQVLLSKPLVSTVFAGRYGLCESGFLHVVRGSTPTRNTAPHRGPAPGGSYLACRALWGQKSGNLVKSGGQTGLGRSGTVTFAILHIVPPSKLRPPPSKVRPFGGGVPGPMDRPPGARISLAGPFGAKNQETW